MEKKRVLSGIRATGRLHLGNYLGAVKGMLELQDSTDYETFYMVADVHTITTPYEVEELRKNRREVILDYLAAGLNPEKSVIFQQSEVNEHIELAFYLSSVTTIAKMQHLPTFKDKVKQYPEHSTMALLNYPILMSSDILIYKAEFVPVGIDQEPHLEVAREIARRMNQDYGTDFPEPQRFKTEGEYVPSLTGEGKMSKSVEGSFINLTDSLNEIKKKIARIPTGSGFGKNRDASVNAPTLALDNDENAKRSGRPEVMFYDRSTGESSPGVVTLLELVGMFEGPFRKNELIEKYFDSDIGLRYGEIKEGLSHAIFQVLAPIQETRRELEANPEYVDKVIREGNEKARAVAEKTVLEVRTKMGLS